MPPADVYDASATVPKLDLLRLIKQLVRQCYPAGCTAFLSKFSPHPNLPRGRGDFYPSPFGKGAGVRVIFHTLMNYARVSKVGIVGVYCGHPAG